ncbi:MAG: thioredoxin domain-containing protein [Micrococcales bacterium]|nr:thioredoxin domain-containing protein [Micrococcales bacterium]
MPNQPRPTKNERREEARAKAAAMRAQQERARRRNRIIGIVVLVAAVVAVGFAVWAMIQQGQDSRREAAKVKTAIFEGDLPSIDEVAVPRGTDPVSGGIPVSAAGVGVAAPDGVRVDVYLDFMCPHCGTFERVNGADLQALAAQDGVTVVYHPLAIMDRASQGTYYSTRAANAAGVVADQSPEHFVAFMEALFAPDIMPAGNTKGLSDARLAEVAQSVGVPVSVTDRLTATADFEGQTLRTFVPWVAASFSAASVAMGGQVGTPAVFIDGERWNGDYSTAGPLRATVEAARDAS